MTADLTGQAKIEITIIMTFDSVDTIENSAGFIFSSFPQMSYI
jgi:hypothetical protein